jgi:uncharacterized membrane protein
MHPIRCVALSVAVLAILVGGSAWERSTHFVTFVFVALPLVLFLPGFAVLRLAIDPATFRLSHALLACGISIAVTICGGFLLHSLGAITARGWMVLLGGITLVSFVASIWRWGWSMPRAEGLSAFASVSGRDTAMFVCALAITVGAYLTARDGALAHREFPATEFWMVPQHECCPNALTLGIRNLEGNTTKYEVEIMLEGHIVGAFRSITVAPGDTWTAEANLSFKPGSGRRAEAWLFKNGDHSVIYRRVWVDAGRA